MKKETAKNNSIFIILLVAVVAGILGFFGGVQFQKGRRVNLRAGMSGQFSGRNGQNSGNTTRQANQFGRPVSGEISSVDDTTITLKTQDGSSKIITYSSSTKINKMSEGSFSDLKVGEKITVMGSESNGTVSAQSISLGTGLFQRLPDQEKNDPLPTLN